MAPGFLDSLSGLFGSQKEMSALGVDIGASSAKIVQLRAARGSAVLETYGEIALGPYGGQQIGKAVRLEPEKLAEALTNLMKEANITARSGGISIPFSSSLVSILDFPKVEKEALRRMVPIEARKYIPVPITEVSLDWFVMPEDTQENSAFDKVTKDTNQNKNKQQVLLVGVQNSTISSYQEMLKAATITPSFFEVEIFSTIRSSVGNKVTPVVVVDLGAATTKVYVVERGVVRLTHLLTVGGQQMTETLARTLGWEFDKAERIKRESGLNGSSAYSLDENEKIKTGLLSTLTRVFSEVNRVVLSYGQRYNKSVSHVILTGGGASLPGLAPQAKSLLSAEVEVADPFAHTEAPAFLNTVLKDIGPGFAVAVGLVLRKLKAA